MAKKKKAKKAKKAKAHNILKKKKVLVKKKSQKAKKSAKKNIGRIIKKKAKKKLRSKKEVLLKHRKKGKKTRLIKANKIKKNRNFTRKKTKKNSAVLRKIKKQSEKISAMPRKPLAQSFRPRIRVIGIGGGGGSIVSEIGRSLGKATFLVADTDVRSFKKKQGIKYFLFGNQLTHGLGTGLNVELAKEAAQEDKEKISQFLQDQDIVIFVACLGGGVGSGATQVFLDAAKSFGGISLGIFTLPFKFEGRNKQRIALKAIKNLKNSLNVSITIPNERIFKVTDENTAITEAFSMVNKGLIESLESLIDLIQSPGVINIDFADLKAILQDRGSSAFLNTAQSSGKDRTDQVIRDILHNPLYQDNFTPEKVLFNIEGGKNLSMFDVDKISKAIAEKNPNAKIIFGISRNPKYKNTIKTTLLMTGGGSAKELLDKEKPGAVVSSGKTLQKVKLKTKKQKKKKQKHFIVDKKPEISSQMMPAFTNATAQELVQRISITEEFQGAKKAIRRSALEIKKAEEIEKNKKSKQEEEWEIPAFIRFKK